MAGEETLKHSRMMDHPREKVLSRGRGKKQGGATREGEENISRKAIP